MELSMCSIVKRYKNVGTPVAACQTQILACNSGASGICKQGASETTKLDHWWVERKVYLGNQTARCSPRGQRTAAWEKPCQF